MANGRRHLDMTAGPIGRQLLIYAIPIFFGELFQQMYNTADAIILGNFVSDTAMAAVGGAGSVTKLLVGFFNGISIGCTVVIARSFGEKNAEKLHTSVYTIVCMSAVIGAVLSVIGILTAEPLLRLLSTPPAVMPLAIPYVKIYFLGLCGLVIYNTTTGILRAVGDSRRPFYLLLFSSALNVALDVLLGVHMGYGVAGVAYATIISQGVAALLCAALLTTSKEAYRLSLRGVPFSWATVKLVMNTGVPVGIQKLLTSLSNVVVLSYINYFGEFCLAGWVVYTKINHFVVVGFQSMGSAVTTFVSQNIGARQIQRAKTGVRCAYFGTLLFAVVISLLIWIFRGTFARLFGGSVQTLYYANLFINWLIMTQIVHASQSIYAGALRGMGYAASVTGVMLGSLILVRQIYLYGITIVANTPLNVGLSFPLGWLTAGVLLNALYRRKIDQTMLAHAPATEQDAAEIEE